MATVTVVLTHGQLEVDDLDLSTPLVGVDGGALICANHNLMMDLAIGDFDSVNENDLELIKSMSKKVVQLEKEKDQSDFEASLDYLRDFDEIIVYTMLGKRFDHTYTNIQLLKSDERIIFIDNHNRVSTLKEKTRVIDKGKYTYLSLFALDEVLLSLSGVKYPLHLRTLRPTDLFALSNEIILDKAVLEVFSGHVLIVESRD